MLKKLFKDLFGPDLPLWAVEVTPTHAVAVEASEDRRSVLSRARVELPTGALTGDVRDGNVGDPTAVRKGVSEALEQAGFSGSEIVLVIPDDAVRIAIIGVDSLPGSEAEREALIRWKLKKTVPFDTETARVTYQMLAQNGSSQLLVALSRQTIVEEYESLVGDIGLHGGIVCPSTPAALNLLRDSGSDVLFVKKTPSSVTTSILMGGRLRFYRKVPVDTLYGAAYPTLMYYQDRLGGRQPEEVVVCGSEIGEREERELSERFQVTVGRLDPVEVVDTYKPALGALQLPV